jgi:Flp pilus assembly protein TadG
MLTAIARYIKPSGGRRAGQPGQVLLLSALAFVVLIGIAGLAVDGGRAYVNRRTLQSAADSGADSAMRMILQDFRDYENGGAPQTFSDCNIHDVVASITQESSTSSASSGYSSKTFVYTNAQGTQVSPSGVPGLPVTTASASPSCPGASSLNLCTDATQTSSASANCVAGLKSTPTFDQVTYLLQVVGDTHAVQGATSNSVFKLQHINIGSSAPWVIWHVDCASAASPPELHGETPPSGSSPGLHDGSIQTIHVSNNWPSSVGCGGASQGNTANSSSFKGFVGDQQDGCSKTTTTPSPARSVCAKLPGPQAPTGGYPLAHYTASGFNGNVQTDEDAQEDEILVPVECPAYTATGACGANQLTALIFPVITQINGQGDNYDFTVAYYVAAVPLNANQAQVVFKCLPPNSTYNHCVVPNNEQSVFSAFLQ